MSSNNSYSFDSLVDLPTYKAGVTQATAYRLLKKFTDDCIQEHGITTTQWFIIGTIYDAGDRGIGITQLSRMVDTNVPYITNTLNLLENKGLVEREVRGNDSRAKIVRIAPDSIKTVKAIEADLRKKMRETIYQNITPEELRAYLTVLYKLSNSLEQFN